ncbi:MAG TPA: DSD1 family PLP-dependent enzyme [Dongiaceae bacterium]|nr:DSD1 family PLP-dependent enzyme [Dongiaceae bacterium]
MRRSDVPTPALLVDIDILDRNIATMRDSAARLGMKLRPHAKAHKCAEIAQRIMAAGAVGISCATIGEAEVAALAGAGGILVTAPLTSIDALERLRRLLLRGADIAVVADHPASVAELARLAAGAGRTLNVVVDVDVGMGRTGCTDTAQAVALARQIAAAPSLAYAGIQAYWGNLQQVSPFAERSRRIEIEADRLRSVIAALSSAGLPPAIVSGGGTGSHRIDAETGLFTEIQPGSYLFMDSCYGAISISENDNPFAASLFVAATVVSANRPGRVVVNAGWKAFATDSGKPVALRGAPPAAEFRFMGDEHGALDFSGDSGPEPGATIEFLTSHCDPTVNLYGAFHVVRGDEVVDVWPIRARY